MVYHLDECIDYARGLNHVNFLVHHFLYSLQQLWKDFSKYINKRKQYYSISLIMILER